jgi:hypothetical protein
MSGNLVKYLPNRLIDRERWDDGVKNAVNGRVYGMSVFLDIFSPGWDALILEGGGAFMPVTRKRKYFISYVCQPLFVQQLGCFFSDPAFSDTLPLFIEKMASTFGFVDIAMNEMNNLHYPGYQIRDMNNFTLRLDGSYEAIFKMYNQNTKRNITRACRMGSEVVPGPPPAEIIGIFKRNNAGRYPGIRDENYNMLQRVLERGLADNFIRINAVRARNGNIIAAACFLRDFDRHVFYFSANTDQGRSEGAMYLLMDHFIEHNAGTGLLLDMNGSMDPGLIRFYSGFGAGKSVYQRLLINNLAFPLNRIRQVSGDKGNVSL